MPVCGLNFPFFTFGMYVVSNEGDWQLWNLLTICALDNRFDFFVD
jgi:hypothetical protein